MAVRTANVYQYQTILSVLGPDLPVSWVDFSHPIDRYPDGMELDPNATWFNEVTSTLPRVKLKGKRAKGDRRYLDPRANKKVASEVLHTLHGPSTPEQRAMVSCLQTYGVTSVVEGAKAAAMMAIMCFHSVPGLAWSKVHDVSQGLCAVFSQYNLHVYPGQPTAVMTSTMSEAPLQKRATRWYLAARHTESLITMAERSVPKRRVEYAVTDDRFAFSQQMLRTHVRRYINRVAMDNTQADEVWDLSMGFGVERALEGLEERRRSEVARGEYLLAATLDDMQHEAIVRLEDIKEVAGRIGAFRHVGFSTVLTNRNGMCLVSGSTALVVTRQDLVLVAELLDEVAGTMLSLGHEYGTKAAMEYEARILRVYMEICLYPADLANMVPCFQRDAEIATKQGPYYEFDLNCKRSDPMKGLREAAMPYGLNGNLFGIAPKGVPYATWIRAMRPIPQVRFSASGTASEAFRSTHVVTEMNPAYREELRNAFKVILAHAHKLLHGDYPQPIRDYLDSSAETRDPHRAFDLEDAPNVSMQGSASFNFGAAIPRDRSNIPKEALKVNTSAEWDALAPDMRRELLYWGTRKWELAVSEDINRIRDGEGGIYPDVITDKPENKEFSRVVTQEEATRRKTNSLIQNNLLPLAQALPGSLLSASNRKKNDVLGKLGRLGAEARREGDVMVYLFTDFTKFGHSIHPLTQRVMLEVVAEYFSEPWIANFADTLWEKRIICPRMGHMSKWQNTSGADGQGMRNALWQLMLAAYPLAIHPILRSLGTDLAVDEPIPVVWFEDDHVFPVRLRMPAELKSLVPVDPTEDLPEAVMARVCNNMRRIEHVITTSYTLRGLHMEMSKNARMLAGGCIVGEHFDFTGPVRNPLKASNRAVVEPSSRIPTLTDHIGNVVGAMSGAAADGMDPLSAYAMLLQVASWKLSYLVYQEASKRPEALGLLALAPQSMGGLGIPLITNFCAVSGPLSVIEFIYALVAVAEGRTRTAQPARNFIWRIQKGAERPVDAIAATVHPLIAPAEGMQEMPRLNRTKIRERLSKYVWALKDYSRLADHFREWIVEVVGRYEAIPFTTMHAYRMAHPKCYVDQEIDRVLGSATAVNLFNAGEIRMMRKQQRAAELGCLHHNLIALSTLALPQQKFHWEDMLATMRTRVPDLTILTRTLIPFAFYVCADGEVEAEYNIIVRQLEKGHPSAPLISSLGVTSYSTFSRAWTTPQMSVLATAIDVYSASCDRTEDDMTSLHAAVSSAWNACELDRFANRSLVHAPYRDIKAVAYHPSDQVANLSALTRTGYADVHSIDTFKSTLSDSTHMAITFAQMAALLWHRATGEYHFHPMEFMVWNEPNVKLRDSPAKGIRVWPDPTPEQVTRLRLPEDQRERPLGVDTGTQSEAIRAVVTAMHSYAEWAKQGHRKELLAMPTQAAVRDMFNIDTFFEVVQAKALIDQISAKPPLIMHVIADVHVRLCVEINRATALRTAYDKVVTGHGVETFTVDERAVWLPADDIIARTLQFFHEYRSELETHLQETHWAATSGPCRATTMLDLVKDTLKVAHRYWAGCYTKVDSYLIFNDEPEITSELYQRYIEGWAARYKEQYIGTAHMIKKRKADMFWAKETHGSLAKEPLEARDTALASLYIVNMMSQFKVIVCRAISKTHASAMTNCQDIETTTERLMSAAQKALSRAMSRILTKHSNFDSMGTGDVIGGFRRKGLNGAADALLAIRPNLGLFMRTIIGGQLDMGARYNNVQVFDDIMHGCPKLKRLSERDMKELKVHIKTGLSPPARVNAYPAYLRDMLFKLKFGVVPPQVLVPPSARPRTADRSNVPIKRVKGNVGRLRRTAHYFERRIGQTQEVYSSDTSDAGERSSRSSSFDIGSVYRSEAASEGEYDRESVVAVLEEEVKFDAQDRPVLPPQANERSVIGGLGLGVGRSSMRTMDPNQFDVDFEFDL